MDRTFTPLALAALLLAACGGPTPSTGPGPEPGPGPRPEPTAERPIYRPISPALPPIPQVDGALSITVIHPTPETQRPRVDSTFVYGNVGTGLAALDINGTPVPVAPNGAFIAYLPMPADGAWRLRAREGGAEVTRTLEYASPPASSGNPAANSDAVFARPLLGTVTGGADTLATGSDAVFARPTPTGTYRWFFPRGARLTLLERSGNQYRVQLGANTEAWIDVPNVTIADTSAPAPAQGPIGAVTVGRTGDGYELRAPAGGRPFLVETTDSTVVVTVYGTGGAGGQLQVGAFDDFLRSGGARALGTASQYVIGTARPAWGYKAWYEDDGDLVVRVRRPPAIDPANPLRGIRIVVDPGHPPAGATGPTGLYEGDANLAIALPLAEKLRARGAEVIMTRTTAQPLVSGTNQGQELRARVALAVERDAHLLISVHNNAFGEGANPFRAHGTSVYYFHAASADLARALDAEIVGVTRIPDIGARQSNLALARPTWMPTALTESLFMPIPEQEAALRNAEFVDRLADAHVRGLEAFLRGRAGGAP